MRPCRWREGPRDDKKKNNKKTSRVDLKTTARVTSFVGGFVWLCFFFFDPTGQSRRPARPSHSPRVAPRVRAQLSKTCPSFPADRAPAFQQARAALRRALSLRITVLVMRKEGKARTPQLTRTHKRARTHTHTHAHSHSQPVPPWKAPRQASAPALRRCSAALTVFPARVGLFSPLAPRTIRHDLLLH